VGSTRKDGNGKQTEHGDPGTGARGPKPKDVTECRPFVKKKPKQWGTILKKTQRIHWSGNGQGLEQCKQEKKKKKETTPLLMETQLLSRKKPEKQRKKTKLVSWAGVEKSRLGGQKIVRHGANKATKTKIEHDDVGCVKNWGKKRGEHSKTGVTTTTHKKGGGGGGRKREKTGDGGSQPF